MTAAARRKVVASEGPAAGLWLGELLAKLETHDWYWFAGHLTKAHAQVVARDESLIGFPAELDTLTHVQMYRTAGPYGWRTAATKQDLERTDLVPATRITVLEVNTDRGRRTVIRP